MTGASGGIGAAVARSLAAAGCDLVLHYASSREPAEALADELGATLLEADLRDGDAAERLAGEAGAVDVLVANAGTGRRREAIEDVTREDWDEHLAVNLSAPFLLARTLAPGMRDRGFGRILFMSSVAAFTGGVVGPHYAASKAGLHGLTHWLASRLAGSGVTVNAIAPALIEETGMLPGSSDELAGLVPVGRLGKPQEVADLALAVLGNGYVTNQVLSVDGGMYPH